MKRRLVLIGIYCTAIIILLIIPTGFSKAIYVNARGARAKVIAIDNSTIFSVGLFRQGEQRCTIQVNGKQYEGINMLSGILENDKLFSVGDTVWVLLEHDSDGNIIFCNVIDHYRIGKELVLAGIFVFALILLSGWNGLRTSLAFLFSLLTIFKVLVPLCLKGYSPLLSSLFIGLIISTFTLILVSGFNSRTFAAIATTATISLFVLGFSVLMSWYFKVDGVTLAWSESLLYSGFEHLDLRQLLQSAIFLSCLGSIMDLSIDVCATVEEVRLASPTCSRSRLFAAGMAMGRAGVGTQATTLLFAYLGSYLAVLMVYMAQGTPLLNILTSKTVSTEIMQTFVGCISLVLVVPVASSYSVLFNSRKQIHSSENQIQS